MKIRMDRCALATLVAAAALAAGRADAAAFTQGNLAVFRADGGGVALSNTGAAIFIDEFTTGGTLAQSIALPGTNTEGINIINNGTATSEGYIGRSPDGTKLAVLGINRAVGGSGNLNTTSSADHNRVVALFDESGAFDLYGFNDVQTSGNPRSVTVSDAGGVYIGTNNTGIRYADLTSLTAGSTGNATTSIETAQTNVRNVKIHDDQLYVSAMAGAFRGVNQVGEGVPTESGQTVTLLPGFDPATNSPLSVYDFWFANDTTLYLADDRSASSSGGIQKWVFNGESSMWGLSYVIPLGTGTGGGARGLIGEIDGEQTILYATTTEGSANRLVSVVDTGGSSEFTLLATAAANTVFRGVDFVPATGGGPTFDVADFNHDGSVNGDDLQILVDNFGTGTTNAQGDADLNGLIDGADVLVYQQRQNIPQFAAVPEPATIGLLAMTGLGAMIRRRR